MNITLRQLKVFEAVAGHLSYTRAAESLHITQPAVSMQIKQLEAECGLPLFVHLGKKVYLTEAGEELHAYSRRINLLLDEAREVIHDLKGLQRGHLKVSVATTANHFASRLLAGFSSRYPGISFSLDVTNREALLGQLANNERDLIIMGQPPGDQDLLADTFLENPLVMIAPAEHALTERKRIPVEHFARETFVVREPGSGTRGATERFFAEHKTTFSPGIEMTSNEAIKQAVEAGLGLAVVSLHTIETELQAERLVVLDVEDFPIQRHWYLVQRRGKRLSQVAAAFRQFVLEEAQHYVSLPLEGYGPPPPGGG